MVALEDAGGTRSGAGRGVLLAAPWLVLLSTLLTFRGAARLWGTRRGYLAGFLLYWGFWCTAVPRCILGPRRVRSLFRPATPNLLQAAALALPQAVGYGLAFPRARRDADARTVALSAGIAAVNGTLEEVLWRGTYLAVFPDDRVRGYLYPAAGFAVWHYAPQSLYPNPRPGGAHSLVAFSAALGLLWGAVARRTGSIRWTALSHVLFDFAGLGGRVYLR